MTKTFSKVACLYGMMVVSVLAGCGRAASEIQETAIVSKLERPASTAKNGVVVDGRWYPKDEAPVVEVTPPPAAPKEGQGHLRVLVNLKGLSGFTSSVTLKVFPKGSTEAVAAITWRDDLRRRGIQTEYTLENLTPGDYELNLQEFNQSGGMFRVRQATATVSAGKNEEARI